MFLDIYDRSGLVGSVVSEEGIYSKIVMAVDGDILLCVGSKDIVELKISELKNSFIRGGVDYSSVRVLPLYREFSCSECVSIVRLAREYTCSGFLRGLSSAFSRGCAREWFTSSEWACR